MNATFPEDSEGREEETNNVEAKEVLIDGGNKGDAHAKQVTHTLEEHP